MPVNSRVDRVFASRHRKVSIVSVLTGVRIKRVNFRNCTLYTGVRIKWLFRLSEIKILFLSSSYWSKLSNQRERNNSVSLWKCDYLRKFTNPARRGVGNKILLLFTFVTVKQQKKILTEWSCAIRLPWNIGTKVEIQNPLSEDAHELKRKYELFLFVFLFSLPAISSNFIFFICTDSCASRDLIEQIMENSELDFLEIFPL